jgi:GT2 family glycosyltransferase
VGSPQREAGGGHGVTAAAPSVAISTRDRPEALRRCLASLREGTLLPAEVVVADQSDGPETQTVVSEASSDSVPVRYLRARRGGLGVAQNDAVGAASSVFVAVLDDDCVADPCWLAELARALEGPPAAGLVAGRVLPLGPDRPGAYPVSSRISIEPRVFEGKALPWDVGSGNNFAVRRDLFEAIGGCDERLGPGSPSLGGVDMDLFYRLLRSGARARFAPGALVLHERTTREGRLSRRTAYGYGMGSCVRKWLGEGDRFAWRVLAAWLRMRGRLLARALARGNWQAAYEEALVLEGTARGLALGPREPRT